MNKILLYPNELLREKVGVVEKVDGGLLKDVGNLEKMLINCENGAGLAAVQIGIGRRFFGIKDVETKSVEVFINPEIEEVFGEKTYPKIKKEDGVYDDFLEGCLSFPNLFGTVKRYLKIRVKYFVIDKGRLREEKETLEGFDAIVFQHERDHLDGIVFVDHIKEEGGKLWKWNEKKKTEIDVKKVV